MRKAEAGIPKFENLKLESALQTADWSKISQVSLLFKANLAMLMCISCLILYQSNLYAWQLK